MPAKTMVGTLTISRVTSTHASDGWITITIEDDDSRTRTIEARMTFADFTEALFGLASRPCHAEVFADLIGYTHEFENRIVFVADEYLNVNHWKMNDEQKRDHVYAALREHVVDGWKPDYRDFFNGHRVRASIAGEGRSIEIGFRRYVHKETGEPWNA